MQKIALLLLPLIFFGCDKTFDEIVDSSPNNYQVTSVSPVDSFSYRPDDSLVTIRIIFTNSSEVGSVFCDVIASDETKLNGSPFQLLDPNGINRFANDFPLSEFSPNGIYNIKFYVQNSDESLQQVALTSFKYNNGQNNLPPEITNTVIIPDTVVVDTTTVISTSVEASDPNGQNDIGLVFFVVYRPDGTSNNNRNELFDDGNIDHGDHIAGDGIYSLLIQVDETNQKGAYRFEFQAVDRGGKFSNKIDHIVLIQ